MNRAFLCLLLALPAKIAIAAAPGPARAVSPDATVRFQTGSTVIDADSERVLDTFAKVLSAKNAGELLIVGHTDNSGNPAANKILSKGRAGVVRAALLKRGVPAKIVSTAGAGDTEPIASNDTPEGKSANRRVELWIVTNAAAAASSGGAATNQLIAHVTWIRNIVEAKRPVVPDWLRAEVGMPLRRRFEVRTQPASAGEITFENLTKLYLESESLVVIYDDARRSAPEKKKVSDVEIKEGSLFARLRERTEPPLVVTSEAGRVELASKNAQVAHSPKKAASTVSVFDGDARVAGVGPEVRVPEGQGTRVKVGQPAEPPTPLPEAPAWRDRGAIVQLGAGNVALAWNAPANVAEVTVEIASLDDPAFAHPNQKWQVKGNGIEIEGPEAGAYRVRLSAIDDRGIRGARGPERKLVVLAGATDSSGKKLAASSGVIELDAPGEIRFAPPPGGMILAGGTGTNYVALGAGEHEVPLQLELDSGEVANAGTIVVRVAPPSLELLEMSPRNDALYAMTRVRFAVRDRAGRPVSTLALEAFPIDGAATSSSAPFAFRRCNCESPHDVTEVSVLRDGTYAFFYQERYTGAGGTRRVRIKERGRDFAAEVEVPVAGEVEEVIVPPPPHTDTGVYGALRGGVEIGDGAGTRPHVAGEFGFRFRASPSFAFDLGLGVSWIHRDISDVRDAGTVNLAPIVLRAGGELGFGSVGVYFGGYGGVRIAQVNASEGSGVALDAAQPAYGGFAGLAFELGVPELVLEGEAGETGLFGTGGSGSTIGFAALAGLRVRQ